MAEVDNRNNTRHVIKKTDEHRRHRRFEVTIIMDYSDGINFFSDPILDIGIGGLQFESFHQLKVGSRITMTLPFTPPIKILGMVVWQKKTKFGKGNFGVKFIEVRPAQDWAVREIVRSLTMDADVSI